MSKSRKNITKFQSYESVSEYGDYQTGYIRMVGIQLICMNELSANAFRVYIMMKNYAKGRSEFEFPHRIYKNFISNQTFNTARQQLVDLGYLEPFTSLQNLRIENKYKFSSKWKERNKEYITEIITNRSKKQ